MKKKFDQQQKIHFAIVSIYVLVVSRTVRTLFSNYYKFPWDLSHLEFLNYDQVASLGQTSHDRHEDKRRYIS